MNRPAPSSASSSSSPAASPSLPFLQVHAGGVLVGLKVQPRASRNELGEILGTELKLKVTAPPVDSAANEAVVRLLADLLDCPRGSVQLVRGQTARHKQILLAGLSLAEADRRFRRLLGGTH